MEEDQILSIEDEEYHAICEHRRDQYLQKIRKEQMKKYGYQQWDDLFN
jgi:hypothetical protein